MHDVDFVVWRCGDEGCFDVVGWEEDHVAEFVGEGKEGCSWLGGGGHGFGVELSVVLLVVVGEMEVEDGMGYCRCLFVK